jgi:hypothetical protein
MPKSKLPLSESTIQEQIVSYLSELALRKDLDVFFFSVPNEAWFRPGRTAHAHVAALKRKGMTPGAPDLVLFWENRVLFIEVKRPGQPLSDNQKVFKRNCQRVGQPYVVVHSDLELAQYLDIFDSGSVIC